MSSFSVRSRTFVAVTASVVLLGLTAPPGSGAASVAGPAHRAAAERALTWGPCPYPNSPETLDCATVTVPLDYAHPRGARTSVTIDRLKATGHQAPVRSLVFDPGGPGGSGTALVYFESIGAHLFSAGVRRHFDLIGLDPRGVGLSNQIACDPSLLNRHVSLFPKSRAAFQRLVAKNRALGRSCLRMSGPLLEHIDTRSAAHDMEAIRRALGQGGLNYLGLSYGSLLGSTYADLFPHHVRRMALDGALVHSLPPIEVFDDEESAYNNELNRFFGWCARSPACALHGRDVPALFDRLVRAADHEPIPAPGCAHAGCRRYVDGEDIRFDAQNLLLFKRPIPLVAPGGWNDLALALKQAANGDASALSAPRAASPTDDALNGSALAIYCLDWPTPVQHYRDLQRLERFGETISPRLAGASQSWTILAGCAGWPAPVVNPPRPVHVSGTSRILITNANHDPSTPYVWAQQLTNEIASSVLVTRNGDGHTSYLAHGPSQTRDAIDRYLITGRTPPPNTVFAN